jgi:uncharacterized protein (DUF58 family)
VSMDPSASDQSAADGGLARNTACAHCGISVKADTRGILLRERCKDMIKSTVRLQSWLPVALVVGLLVLHIFSPARSTMFILVVLGTLLLVSYVWARGLAGGVSLTRKRRYGWAQVGDVLQERWVMHNNSWIPVLWAEVREFSDLVGYDASRAVGLGSKSSHQWTTQGVCQMRGVFTLGPLLVTMGDPFGFFRVELRDAHTDSFVVYPAVAALPQLIQPRGVVQGNGRVSVRSLEFTTNASSVRNYAPGDAVKRIHWRSTARRSLPDQDDIYVKEFDLEPTGDLWIILDMDRHVHAGEGPQSTQEYAVTLAASLANQMLRANRAVGLATHNGGPVLIAPQKGHQQLWELLQVLAGVYAVAEISMSELLRLCMPALSRNITVVAITPSADAAWLHEMANLMAHGVHTSALLLDAASFGGTNGLGGMHGALADLGVQTHIIGKSFRFEHVTKRESQEPEFKVLGTGRVVAIKPKQEAVWQPVGPSERYDG